jgi:hypothetical protein
MTAKTKRSSGIGLSISIALCAAGLGATEIVRKGSASTAVLLFFVAASWLGIGLFYFLGESNAKAIATVSMQMVVAAVFTWLGAESLSYGNFGLDIALILVMAGLSWWIALGKFRDYWNKRLPTSNPPAPVDSSLLS